MHKRMTVGIFLVIMGIYMPNFAWAFPEIKSTSPRLANYFLHWTVSNEEAEELAKWDIIILDPEVSVRTPSAIPLMRKLNPQAVILAYVAVADKRQDWAALRDIAPIRYKLALQIPENWMVKNASGELRSFWPGAWIVNVTNAVTPVNGKRWNTLLPELVVNEILNTGLWDGVFYDSAWDDITHFARGTPDLDLDGITDDPRVANDLWHEGLRTIYRTTAAFAPEKLVFENDGPMYAADVHGVLLENFPRKGWSRYRDDLKTIRERAKAPAIPILNATTFNSGRRDDFRAMRFGLVTAMLMDAYYSFDFGDQDHGQTWWYDEYGVFLGDAISTPQGRDIVRRDFERGMVLINPGEAERRIELPIEIEKVRGTQDAIVNDGLITRELTISGGDGRIVFRPLTAIAGIPFENGIFARVFNLEGAAIRAGFFAYDRRERSGVVLAVADFDGDAKDERVRKGDSGALEVQFGDGRRERFYPFGRGWTGEITFALGDTTGDGLKELVVGQGRGGGEVRVYRPGGTLTSLPFFPFGPRYRGGVNVAVGDLNGDGFSEIVVGAGPGGGPQVRIFSGEGRLLSGGFFAYDPRFRGGVRVSVGDVNQDGRAEIVTGPGPGGGPQVRVFDDKGRAIGAGFFAYDRASRSGAIPLVTDIDGDGRNEILAVTKEVL